MPELRGGIVFWTSCPIAPLVSAYFHFETFMRISGNALLLDLVAVSYVRRQVLHRLAAMAHYRSICEPMAVATRIKCRELAIHGRQQFRSGF
jgi:hypothetical protein